MNNIDPSLEKFFCPEGIVIIGVSSDPGKLGYQIARNLVNVGYRGAVQFVNPRGGQLFGRPVYPDLSQVPEPIDLAILLIPAPATPQVLQACGERGIRAVIVSSSGFRETGPEGAKLEKVLLETARKYGIRLIGPNCIGLMDTHLPLDTTFLKPPPPQKGDIAFISHSGATCAAVVDWSRGQGFGFSRLVSLGNQIDVNEIDMLITSSADSQTRCLALYLETVSDGKRFVDVVGQISRIKPVVTLKSGRFASGQRAAASHTGALAGKDVSFEAAFRRTGVIRATTIEELFEWSHTLARCPLPNGNSIAVLTSAGGLGVTAADALEANGMQLAELRTSTRLTLQTILPPAASTNNPVDMLASATPEQYASCLANLLADPDVDGVLVIVLPPPFATDSLVSDAILPVIKTSMKPVLTTLVGDLLIKDDLDAFRKAQIPEFRFPERAAAALAVLVKRALYLNAERNSVTARSVVDREAIQVVLDTDRPGKFEEMMNLIGITTLQVHLANNRQEAANLAQQIGFPVVLKIASPDLTHKSDIGGVILDIKDEQSVLIGFDHLVKTAQKTNPIARIEGVTVQHMAPKGQEVIIGAVQDPLFGPIVMFGSGGIEVEGLKDTAFALAPLTTSDAEFLLESTWAGRKLRGYRSIAPVDRDAVIDALLRLSQFVSDFPQITEVEINPLRVLPLGMGVMALDVRVVSS
jgi:acetyltransferase